MKRNHEIIEIACQVKHETEKAFLVFDGDKDVWLPKTQCEWDGRDKVMQMPEWLAMEKGLI